MKKIMVLGAGSCQLNLIKRLKKNGFKVIVTGYKEDSPGKLLADASTMADTFSYEETLEAAKNYKIHGIMTTGTDQPVLTATKVAETLNLPRFLSEKVAYNVTNKKAMKEIFKSKNIPTVAYCIINKDTAVDLINIDGPLVMKPLDSQGQRGIFKLKSKNDIHKYIDETLYYSRSTEVLIEKYYENQEITVSGWVSNEVVNIFTMSDRVTFDNNTNIGICKSHEYPSIHLKKYKTELIALTNKICKAFEIKEGPIYFQMLIGDEGIMVNEIACRLGGAYEDITIPLLTGIDPLSLLINNSIYKNYDSKVLEDYAYNDERICVSTQLFFCNSGLIEYITPKAEMIKNDFILGIGYNYEVGDFINKRVNASQRAGYFIVKGDTEKEVKENIVKAFNKLLIKDINGKNLVIQGERGNRE